MDNEMIERVAKAIADTDDSDMADAKIGWDNCDSGMREDYRREARAAIAAMREPTEKMIDKGSDVTNYDDVGIGLSLAKEVYTTMIDAIIGE